jgi:chromosome segregation ATPase
MKTTSAISAAFLGLSLSAFAQAPAKVTYNEHILPIFRNSCTNCHNPDKKKAGLDVTTYQATMAGSENGAVVKPGNADGSLIYKVCLPNGDPKMPPKGDQLSEGEMGMLKNWIAGFALENPNSKPAQVTQNKVDVAVVSLTKPDGPPPMPGDLPMEPFVRSRTSNAVVAMAASPWAPLLAIGGQKQVLLYHTESLEPLGVLAFPEGMPNVVRFSSNSKLLIAGGGLGGKLGKVVLWDVATGERIGVIGNEADAVLAADISPDQQFVALGGPNKQVKIFRTKDGKQTGLIKKHTEWVTAVAYSPDGKYLATADRNGGVEVWESGAEPKPFNTLAGHKSACTALAFMPGVLASASEDGKVALWNVKEGTEIRNWAAHAGGVLWVDFTPDGRLVSCGRDKLAKVWDATGKQIVATEAFNDLALRCTLNGDRVIAADWTGDIRVYGIDGKKVGGLTANPPGIAEQLALAEKTASEAQAALPGLQKAVADAEARVKAEREAAEAKRKTDLAGAEQRKTAAQQALDATKAAPGNAQKALESVKTQITAAEAALAAARKAAGEVEAAAASPQRANAEAGVATAKQKVDPLKAAVAKATDVRAKAAQGSPELTKADQELQARNAELAAAEKALAAAQQALAAVPVPPGREKVEAAKAAANDAQKNLEKTRQRLQEAQAELARSQEKGPARVAEAEKALKAVQDEIQRLQAAATPPPPGEAEKALALAKGEFEAATARLAAAQSAAVRWKRAQVYQAVFNARRTAAEKQAQFDDLVATAKDAFRQVEIARQNIAAAQKTVADGPKNVAEKEAEFAKVKQGADSAKAALDATEKAVEAKKTAAIDPKGIEAELAEANAKLASLTTESNKRREARVKFKEGTPEYAKANEPVQAIKADIAKAEAAVAAAKAKQAATPAGNPVPPELIEAVKKATLDLKLASGKVPAAEKALASAKKEIEDAKKQAAELAARLPDFERDAAKIKATAEKDSQAVAQQLQAAKAEAERLRAQYEASKNAGKKTASVSVPPKG